jgi:hypothetical protein
MKNENEHPKTGNATVRLLAALIFFAACLGLMGCTVSSEGWTEEQIVEANKKLMQKELGIEESAARQNAEVLAKLGVGRIVEISEDPGDYPGVRRITMKDDKGKVYWSPISDKVETMDRINEDGPRGKTIYFLAI